MLMWWEGVADGSLQPPEQQGPCSILDMEPGMLILESHEELRKHNQALLDMYEVVHGMEVEYAATHGGEAGVERDAPEAHGTGMTHGSGTGPGVREPDLACGAPALSLESSAPAGPPSPSFNKVRQRRDSGNGRGVVGELGAANSPLAAAAAAAVGAPTLLAACCAPPTLAQAPTLAQLFAACALHPDAQMPPVPRMPRRKAMMRDSSGDGIADQLLLDSTGDGVPNQPVSSVAVDTTGDGRADALIADSNGDGRGDCLVLDTSGDGIPDTAVVGMLVDLDNDGQADVLLV